MAGILSDEGQVAMPYYEVPLLPMTRKNAKGLGRVIRDFNRAKVSIVRWPQKGWRPVERGNEGGVVDGSFTTSWQGDFLVGCSDNFEVDNFETHFVVGCSVDPAHANRTKATGPRDRVLVEMINYHPDGGQVFFSKNRRPFILLLAPPGDDVAPEDCVALRSDGDVGFHIDPGVWHQAPITLASEDVFFNKQGRVHGEVTCFFPAERGLYLYVPLKSITTGK